MTALEAQAFIRLTYHLAGLQILTEPTLKRDVTFLLERAGVAVGIVVNVNTANVLHTLALAVAS